MTTKRRKVWDHLTAHGPMRTRDVAKAIGLSSDAVRKMASSMHKAGQLTNETPGAYAWTWAAVPGMAPSDKRKPQGKLEPKPLPPMAPCLLAEVWR